MIPAGLDRVFKLPPRLPGVRCPDELRAEARRRLGRMRALECRANLTPEEKAELEQPMREFWQLLCQADGNGRRGA